jgi:hypothetical protein
LLLTETVAFLLSAGVKRHRLSSQLRDQARSIAKGQWIKTPRAASYQRLTAVASVVHDWRRDRRYTDKETGEPIALSEGTVRELIALRVPPREVDGTLASMQENGYVRVHPGGLLALATGRHVIIGFGLPRALAMERAAALAPQFLRTALRNARTADPGERDLDRIATVSHLPAKFVPLFREQVREKLLPILEFLDNWLEDHNAPGFEGQTVETSIHAHTYTGEPRTLSHAMNVGRRHKRAD